MNWPSAAVGANCEIAMCIRNAVILTKAFALPGGERPAAVQPNKIVDRRMTSFNPKWHEQALNLDSILS